MTTAEQIEYHRRTGHWPAGFEDPNILYRLDPTDPTTFSPSKPTGDLAFPDYDRFLRRLADAQRYKLRLNAHKGDLGTVPVERLLNLLKGEIPELEEAINRGSEIEVILEAADICNFALGIVISAIRSMNEEKTK